MANHILELTDVIEEIIEGLEGELGRKRKIRYAMERARKRIAKIRRVVMADMHPSAEAPVDNEPEPTAEEEAPPKDDAPEDDSADSQTPEEVSPRRQNEEGQWLCRLCSSPCPGQRSSWCSDECEAKAKDMK